MSTDNKNLSVVNCFFWTEGHKDKRGYGNRMFGRNKSYVLLSKNNKNLSVKELLFFDIRTQGQKGI